MPPIPVYGTARPKRLVEPEAIERHSGAGMIEQAREVAALPRRQAFDRPPLALVEHVEEIASG